MRRQELGIKQGKPAWVTDPQAASAIFDALLRREKHAFRKNSPPSVTP